MLSLSGLLWKKSTGNTLLFLFIRHQIDTDREWILGKNLEETWIPPVELLESKEFITMTFSAFQPNAFGSPPAGPLCPDWAQIESGVTGKIQAKVLNCKYSQQISLSEQNSRCGLSRASLKRHYKNPAVGCNPPLLSVLQASSGCFQGLFAASLEPGRTLNEEGGALRACPGIHLSPPSCHFIWL